MAPILEEPISLEEYAFVTSGLLDGFERAELLAYRDIDTERWERGAAHWDGVLRSDSETYDAVLSARQLEARALWQRPIPPIDRELRAWLDFQRTVLASAHPLAALEKIPLTLGDVVGLQAMWQERLVKERELAEEATRILGEPPGEVRVPPPVALRLPARLPTAPANSDASLHGVPLPFHGVSRTEPGEARAEPEAHLSVGHYAALCVELEIAPHRHREILARYALTFAMKDELDHVFAAQSRRDPDLRAALADAADAYRRWRRHL